MTKQGKIQRFWDMFLATLPEVSPYKNREIPHAWQFGRGDAMAQELAGLVVQGIKQATASLLWEYELGGEVMPKLGDLSIILDGRNEPVCLIETTRVSIVPFGKVSRAFAFTEGEGDKSLVYWREVHWRFFSINCQELGLQPTQDMLVVCEEFRRIYPLAK